MRSRHAVLRSRSTRPHSSPVISRPLQPVESAKRQIALGNPPFRTPPAFGHATLVAYTRIAYSTLIVFVELTPFGAFRDEYWTDDDLRALQSFLLVSPDAGDLIRGGAGLRKLRRSAQGRGKRGGARVIYLLARSQAPHLLDLRVCEEQARGPDTAANQGARRTDEGSERWISGISISW